MENSSPTRVSTTRGLFDFRDFRQICLLVFTEIVKMLERWR